MLRPTAARVQEAWEKVGQVWPKLTEEEQTDLLSLIVQCVELTEKESVTLELLPISHSPISYSDKFALNSQMGAGSANTYTLNPRSYGVPVFVPSGGRNRLKVPRPERRTINTEAV